MSEWEHVKDAGDIYGGVKRIAVPGGWLYQVERQPSKNDGFSRWRVWHPPVFVPEPK